MDPDSFNLSPSRKHNTSQISCHYLDTFLPPIWGYISQLVTFVSAVFVVVPLSGTCMSHFNRLYSYMGINRFTLKSGTCNCLFSKFLYWKYYSGQLFIIFFVTYKYGCFFFLFIVIRQRWFLRIHPQWKEVAEHITGWAVYIFWAPECHREMFQGCYIAIAYWHIVHYLEKDTKKLAILNHFALMHCTAYIHI